MHEQPWPDGYESVKCIHRGVWAEVFTATRASDGRAVVLKVFGASDDCSAHARTEWDAMRACPHPGIPEAIDLDSSGERPCLVMARVYGMSLRSLVASRGPMEVEQVLEFAIGWARSLESVHRARLVHRDVTPNNLMVELETRSTYLIDFGIADSVGATTNAPVGDAPSSGGTGTLLFIAPEQTGRMNRRCGFQSDLYGLGGTLYFALTGRPPFEFKDPLELIHAHIAREPVSPGVLRSEIPEPVSRLILKLLAKEPSDRYSSAASLGCDLIAMHEQWLRSGEIDPDFELEATEVPDRPRYPSKLYGREGETVALWRELESAIAKGPRLVFVEGGIGSGKSALIDTLRARLGEVGAYLLQGHFDASRERAYAGFVGCLEGFAEQVLVESDARLAEWRASLLAGVGALGAALRDLAPDLAAVLGEVPELPAVGPRETRARVLLAFQRFLAAASTREHPLVLFLDAFEHSDAESRAFLCELLGGELGGSLLVVIACQNHDAVTRDIGTAVRTRLEELGVPLARLELSALGGESLLELLGDTFGKSRTEVAALAELVERKTGGHPLWVRQFIDYLHARDWIRFEIGTGWCWDLDGIAGATIPEGAIGLLVAKLDGLERELRATLGWASCATQAFGAELLSHLGGIPPDRIGERLLELETLGVLVPSPEGFRFADERIREAAQEGVTREERMSLHAGVARWLLERLPKEDRGAASASRMEIAHQLVLAESALPSDLRTIRIERCLEAGRQVLQSGAALGAQRYLDAARESFEESDWDAMHALGIGLWLASAESAFQGGDPHRALELLGEVEARVHSEIERAQLETQRLIVLSVTRPAEECAAYALEVLRRWGVRWPMHPSWLRTWFTLRRSYQRILRRAKQGVSAPGGQLSPERLAGLMVFGAVGGVLARTDVRLVAIATAFALEQPMPREMAMREAYSVGHYGIWMQLVLGDRARAEALSAAGQAWIKQTGDTLYAPRLETNLRYILHPIHMRRGRALAGLDGVVERLAENGDVEFAYYGQFLKSYYGILGGESIPAGLEQLSAVANTVRKMGARFPDPERCLHAFRWLAEDPVSEPALEADARASERQLAEDAAAAEAWESTLWGLVLCVYGSFEALWRISELSQLALYRRSPYVHIPHHVLYRGIAAAELAESTGKRSHRRALRRATKDLKRWVPFGPDFLHMFVLLQAEEARVAKRFDQAHLLYEQAVRGALAQDFVHHAALAKERRTALLLRSRRAREGREAVGQAIQLYERWGAGSKVKLLKLAHAELL